MAEYVGGISAVKPLRLHANSGFITSLTGTAATITTLTGNTGTYSIFRASSNLFTPLLLAQVGIVTTLGGSNLTYDRSNVGLSTVTNQRITDWIGTPVAYTNVGFTTTAIVTGWIGAPTAYINTGIVTTISGSSATYTNLRATSNLISNANLFSPVGVVTIMRGTQANYSGIVTASQLRSTIAQGASPFIVASTTMVNNLNAEFASNMSFGSANQVVFKNSSNNGATSANLTFDGTNLVCGGFVESTSDEKLKTNIKTIENGLEKVLQLRGVEYDRIDIDSHQIGVIAQEVEQIVPEVVSTNSETGTKSVAYGNLVGVLIEAIKDLKVEISELKQKVDKLEASK
jgi:hypothetical protein